MGIRTMVASSTLTWASQPVKSPLASWNTIRGWHWQVIMYSLRGRKKRKKDTKKSFKTPPTFMLVVVRWTFVLRPFAECLSVRSSILQSAIQVWFWDLELFTVWIQFSCKSVSGYLCNPELTCWCTQLLYNIILLLSQKNLLPPSKRPLF
jgi:hypothetical protein